MIKKDFKKNINKLKRLIGINFTVVVVSYFSNYLLIDDLKINYDRVQNKKTKKIQI